MMRTLDPKEKSIVSAIMAFSAVREWEFSAAVDSNTFDLQYFGTQMLKDTSEFPDSINDLAKNKKITVHHNHLSETSLSWPDWNGLTDGHYHETFAHCADHTVYRGHVVNTEAMNNIIVNKKNNIDNDASQALMGAFVGRNYGRQFEGWATDFFIKHVIAEALKAKGYVHYDVFWGARLLPIQAMIAVDLINVVTNIQGKIP